MSGYLPATGGRSRKRIAAACSCGSYAVLLAAASKEHFVRETRRVCGAVAAAARARHSGELEDPLGAAQEPSERGGGARGEPSTLLERRLRTAERGPPPSHGVLERNLPPGAPTRRSEVPSRDPACHTQVPRER